ncbi:linker for activation of T-cells family member 2-like isoform X3 [Rhinoraja longicauda]
MNQAELWWAGLSILFTLPLGILVLLCTRCRQSRSRMSRSQQKPSPEPEAENEPASNVVISPDCPDIQPSYMNLNIENNHRLDQDYINPLSADYYCTPCECIKSADDDDDSNSYENVQINKAESQTSVVSAGSYENCEYAVKWKTQEKPEEMSGENDDEDDEEPDYVNTVPCPSL